MPLAGVGALGPALLAPAITLTLVSRSMRRASAVGLCLTSLAVLYVPIYGLSLFHWARGVMGDLSVPALVLLAASICARLGGPDLRRGRELDALSRVVAVGALVLYPTALGLSRLDPYSLGFESTSFIVVLGCVALAAWARGLRLLLLSIVASVALHGLSFGESTNLWDYLIDPFLSLYALHWLARNHLFRRDLRSSLDSPNLGKPRSLSVAGLPS